jgi:hypothetical protein
MDVLALCGLQDRACGLLYDAESVLYGIGALAASACSGRHGCSIAQREYKMNCFITEYGNLIGLSLGLLGALLLAIAQSRLFLVIHDWLMSLDLTVETWLAGPRAPIVRAEGWDTQMERTVPWARKLSTLGWILVLMGFAAQIPSAIPK